MKILFLTSTYPSKEKPIEGIFIKEHAKAVKIYDEIIVLHIAGANDRIRKLWLLEEEKDVQINEGITTLRVWHKHLPIGKINYLLYLWSAFKGVRHIISHFYRPDIIHAHIFVAAFPAAIIGEIFGIPIIVSEQYSVFPRKLLPQHQIWRTKYAFKKAKYVLPVSEALKKAIEEYGIKANYVIVPNVVDTELFFPQPSLNSPHIGKKLLFVGNLDVNHIKGIPCLLGALRMLRERREDWSLDIVGDGPSRPEYEKLTIDLGLNDKISFLGIRSKKEISELMRKADIFVLPSIWESLPCVLLEAMASGLPIVSTNVGGIPEIIDDNIGYLIPPKDPLALCDALNFMIDNIGKFDRKAISEKAKKFSHSSIGSIIHSIYEKALEW